MSEHESEFTAHSIEDGFEREWDCDFHGVSYVVTVEVFGAVLRVVAEETETNDRWKGEFSSQYIEEITQKAGNFKKFPIFVRMLCSALSRESDSVFVDLLTYGDLEMLKAKKTGGSVSASASSLPSRSQSKRYIILTYSGEFDRVHFPIPLAFEEEPDAGSLQRTIARLKRSLLDKTRSELDQSARDDSHPTASQLRQENMELRHRLRKFEGRSLPSGTGPAAAVSAAASQQNGELLLAYSKLKRQYEVTKKELHAATMAYDRLRTESAKEITRLKIQVAGDSTPKAQSMDNIELARKLRAQCVQLKKDLDTERAEHKRCIVRHQRELANLRHSASTYPKRGATTPTPSRGSGTSARRSSPSGGLPPRPSSAGASRSTSNSRNSMTRRSTTSPTPTRRSTTSSSRDANTTRRSSSPLYGRSSHASAVGSPDSRGGARDRYARSGSRSPSPVTERPAWNSGSGSRRKSAGYESGYSSAASQSSAGSRRSRGSARSTGQSSVATSRSGRSGTSERKAKKKVHMPMYSDDSDVPSTKGAGKKKKSTRRPKEKKKEKESKVSKPRDVLDIDILEEDARHSRTGLGEPIVVRSPPRDSTRRSRDAEGEQLRLSRENLRASGDSISRHEYSNTVMSVRRSDESKRSVRSMEVDKEVRSSRESRRDRGIYTSASAHDGVLGTSLYGTQRLDPNSFPVSKLTNPESRDSYSALNGDYDDDDDAMRRAFDGLSMAKRSTEPTASTERTSSEQQFRRSHDSESSNFMRRSREANAADIDKGGTVASKPVVITRAGPPRGEARKEKPPVKNQSPPSDSEEDGAGSGGENDISEIDKRIKALQSFLDKARSGIIGDETHHDDS